MPRAVILSEREAQAWLRDAPEQPAKPPKYRNVASWLCTACETRYTALEWRQMGRPSNCPTCRLPLVRFDSQAELRRYHELRLLERQGVIRGLVVHPRWDLHAPGGVKVGRYTADLAYYDADGRYVVEDVKGGRDGGGTRTQLYARNKRHLLAEYGIEVTEVSR